MMELNSLFDHVLLVLVLVNEGYLICENSFWHSFTSNSELGSKVRV